MEERERVLSRFRQMKFRSFTTGFVPLFETWFDAKTPAALEDAVRQRLLHDSRGKPKD